MINPEEGGLFGRCHGLSLCTGARYLGGYIGYRVSKSDWLKNWAEKFKRDILALSKTADKYPC